MCLACETFICSINTSKLSFDVGVKKVINHLELLWGVNDTSGSIFYDTPRCFGDARKHQKACEMVNRPAESLLDRSDEHSKLFLDRFTFWKLNGTCARKVWKKFENLATIPEKKIKIVTEAEIPAAVYRCVAPAPSRNNRISSVHDTFMGYAESP